MSYPLKLDAHGDSFDLGLQQHHDVNRIGCVADGQWQFVAPDDYGPTVLFTVSRNLHDRAFFDRLNFH
jgi:hypothetical protein